MYDQIPGLNNPEAQKTILHAWKAGPETVALRKQLEGMRDGGVYILSIPKAPFRCPPGPYERVCQVAHYFKTAKPRSKVILLDGNEDIVSKKGLFLAAWNDLYKGIVEYRPNQEAKDVDVKGMTIKTEFDSFKGDVLNVVPPHGAALIARQAKLITSNNRWCGVNWQTTESIAVAGVYVLGDATLSAAAMPKSASMANNHAKLAASAIVATMTGAAAESGADHQQHLLQLRLRPGGDARRLGAPLDPGEEGARAGPRLRRRLGAAQRAGKAVRRRVGAEHLGRHAQLGLAARPSATQGACGRPLRLQALPVLPKPPAPRSLSANASTTFSATWSTGTITSCAIRSSGWSV